MMNSQNAIGLMSFCAIPCLFIKLLNNFKSQHLKSIYTPGKAYNSDIKFISSAQAVFFGKKTALLLTGLLLLTLLTKGEAMSLLPTPQKVVLSSPLEGTLLYEGKPISAIKVERKLRWFDGEESYEDFVFTDSKGDFSLPIVQKTLELSSLVQFVVVQEIFAILDGERIVIWALGKGSKIEYSELGGKPINLRCELTSEERITRDYNNPMMTRCTWDALEPWVDTEYPD